MTVSTSETAAPVLDPENPWPGLDVFSEESERFFNGRDAEAAELFRRVKRETLTVLFGQSGLGKTSLLKAGLFPMLRGEDYLPVYVRLDYGQDRPPMEEQIWGRLTEECTAREVEAPPRGAASTLWEYLHRADAAFWNTRNRPATPVIILDQFEEIFTIGRENPDDARRADFISSLGELLSNRVPDKLLQQVDQHPEEASRFDFRREPCRFVVSIREDYLADLESERFQALLRASTQNRMRIEQMRSEQALKAVLVTGGAIVEPPTARAIVAFLAGVKAEDHLRDDSLPERDVEPAILSVFCRELNEKRKRLGRATIGTDLLQGSQEEILRDFYDRSLRDLDPGIRRFIEDKLVTESGYRDSRAVEEALREPGVSAVAIDTLVDRRVLRREERFRVMRLELTHDMLTRVAMESRKRRRDEEQQVRARRRTRSWIAVASAMLLLAAIGLVFGLHERRVALEHQRVEQSLDNAAFYLATAREIGRDTLTQNLATADSLYARSCHAGLAQTSRGCSRPLLLRDGCKPAPTYALQKGTMTCARWIRCHQAWHLHGCQQTPG